MPRGSGSSDREERLVGLISDCDELIADLEAWCEHGTYADHPLARATDSASEDHLSATAALEGAFGVRVRLALIESVEEGVLDPCRELPTCEPLVADRIPGLIDDLTQARMNLAAGL